MVFIAAYSSLIFLDTLPPVGSPHCANNIKDAKESYVDCSASCRPCTDCSHNTVHIGDRLITDQLYIRASQRIISDGIVISGRSLIFRAVQSIELSQNFESKGEMLVEIGSCN